MDIELIALDLDICLGLCHCFCLGILELFHDDDVVVVDAIRYIDETVIIRIPERIRIDSMLPWIC